MFLLYNEMFWHSPEGSRNMSTIETCKNYEKCPIYSGQLRGKFFTASAYRNKYCDAGSTGWTQCRRYQVKERTGTCPPGILPNALLSLEDIIRKMGLQQAR